MKNKQKYIVLSSQWSERDNFTCLHCGVRKHLSVDHIVPESGGGTLSSKNLQTLCRTCNSKKGGFRFPRLTASVKLQSNIPQLMQDRLWKPKDLIERGIPLPTAYRATNGSVKFSINTALLLCEVFDTRSLDNLFILYD